MVTFKPFAASGFEAYKEKSTEEYAQDLIQSGKSKKRKALREAKREFESILPQGISTPNHYLNHLMNEQGENVGFMWYGINDKDVFIYDFWIDENQRRKGFGRQALAELCRVAESQGFATISLHAFDYNKEARALYTSMGFEVSDTSLGSCYMQKKVNAS